MQKVKILKNIILTLLTLFSCYYSKWSFSPIKGPYFQSLILPKGFTKGLLYSKGLQTIFYPCCVITSSLFTNLKENANSIKGLKKQVGISFSLNLLSCPCEVTYG